MSLRMSYSNGMEEVHGTVLRRTMGDHGVICEGLEGRGRLLLTESHNAPVRKVRGAGTLLHRDHRANHMNGLGNHRDRRTVDRLEDELVRKGERRLWGDYVLI